VKVPTKRRTMTVATLLAAKIITVAESREMLGLPRKVGRPPKTP